MRRASFLLLLLVLGSLLAAAPVRAAETSYYALSFDGEDDYVYADSFPSLTGQFSIVVLAKWNGGGDDYQRIVSSERWTDADGNGANERWGVLVNIYNNSVRIVRVVNGSPEKAEAPISPHKVFLATGVYDGSELRIYLNSTLISSVADTRQMYDYGGGLALGKKFHEDLAYFDGTIYLVLIYSRALSDEEIQQIYADPLNPPTDGLVLEYLPSSVDTANNVWKDLSGNGNDGTIVGASYVPLRPISEALSDEAMALSFDGENDYITTNYDETTEMSVVVFFQVNSLADDWYSNKILSKGDYSTKTGWWIDYAPAGFTREGKLRFWIGAGDGVTQIYTFSNFMLKANETICFVATTDGKTFIRQYVNGVFDSSKSFNTTRAFSDLSLTFAHYGSGYSNITVYLVLIYNRALSDDEIKQIYENPLNPPRDGLVLFYSPYSYDPETGKWLNIAPIFPTVPLSEELDATNYGATPERVSIPSLSVYDAVNGTPISPLNVSLSMLYNNTTIGLIPTLPVLPWNATVTLNVSATGHYPRLLTTWTGIDSLAVYLQPVPGNNTTSYTLPSESDVPTAPSQNLEQPNDFGLWGSQLGAKFMAGQWSEAFTDFWTLNNLFAIVLPIIFSAGLIIMSWMVTRKPIVPIGVTAVLATFFGMIGVPLRLAVIGPLGGFFLFMLVWLGWDFYKRFERG